MCCETVALLIIFYFQLANGLNSSEVIQTDLSFNQTVIFLCSENLSNSSLLLVPTNDGSMAEIDLSESHYKASIKKLTCRENEYERALKMSLYNDDKWILEVRRDFKLKRF